jgi:4-hydroxythreonine-4-phosphate dehydrogenase
MEKEEKKHQQIRVGISIGDINGIGPEVIIKSLKDIRVLEEFTPIIYGSSKAILHCKKMMEAHDFSFQVCAASDQIEKNKINIINCWDQPIESKIGFPTTESATLAIKSLEKAALDLANGDIDVLVTAPISKESVQQAGFKFPGHTEYLADMAGQEEALMIMVSPQLRVALVTTHIPIKEVAQNLSKEKIVNKISEFEKSLRRDFGIMRPKIAVLGLNPHAGENGKIGQEEQEIINPAIAAAKNNGHFVYGPFAADGFFGSDQRMKFDGVLAMYHDQGLTAFKALAFDEGVNFTAGLPIVRTSPDHGTAFDIAPEFVASAQSMRSAIYLAIDIHKTRKFEREIVLNALPITVGEKDKANSR